MIHALININNSNNNIIIAEILYNIRKFFVRNIIFYYVKILLNSYRSIRGFIVLIVKQITELKPVVEYLFDDKAKGGCGTTLIQ